MRPTGCRRRSSGFPRSAEPGWIASSRRYPPTPRPNGVGGGVVGAERVKSSKESPEAAGSDKRYRQPPLLPGLLDDGPLVARPDDAVHHGEPELSILLVGANGCLQGLDEDG